MLFRLEFSVHDLPLEAKPGGQPYPVVFDVGGLRQHRVEFSPTREVPNGGRCCVFGTYKANEDVERYVDELSRAPEGGRVERPKGVAEFLKMVPEELWALGTRASRVVRWRLKLRGRHDPFTEWGLFVATGEGSSWIPIPRAVSVAAEPAGILFLAERPVDDFVRLLGDEQDEPIARQIFREATENRRVDRRTALILGCVAAEVGMKSLVATRGGSLAAWMAWEVPAPPLERMCRELFQMVGGFSLPDAMLKTIKNGVQQRNLVVHRGTKPPEVDFLETFLACVDQLLFVVDALCGEAWATKYLDGELQKLLKKAESKDKPVELEGSD